MLRVGSEGGGGKTGAGAEEVASIFAEIISVCKIRKKLII
jgi:hypothetical protein